MSKQADGFHSGARSPFRTLPADVVQQVSPHVRMFTFKKKQLLFREGFKPDGLYLIRKGRVKVTRSSANGKEVIVYLAGVYDVPGFLALLCNSEHMTTAEAIEDTEAYFIPKKVFFDLVEINNTVLLKLTHAFFREYDNTLNKLVDISTKQVRRRVAEALMNLMKVHGMEDDDITINIVLSREDLAHLVGTNTETLVRILSEFKKEKIIGLKGKKIQISNPALLARVIALS